MNSVLTVARDTLPHGRFLPADAWARRHASLVVILTAHAVVFAAVAVAEHRPIEALAGGAAMLAFAAVASVKRAGRRFRAGAITVGLLTASALGVHLSGGYIEAHFHFFVVVGLLALYQDALPFVVALAYVALHHGVIGSLAPEDVFNHRVAQENPLAWAAVHAGFVTAVCVIGVVSSRLNERVEQLLDDAQDEAIRGERRLRSLVQHGVELLVLIERDDTIRWISDSATRLLGEGPDQIAGRSCFDYIHPDDWEAANSLTTGDGESSAFRKCLLRLRHTDGSWRPFSVVATNLLGDPDVAAIVVNAQDVTDQIAAEEELRRSEERFRALVQNTSDIIAILEADGRLRYASPAAERVLGAAPPVGENVFDTLVHPDDAARLLDAYQEAVLSAESSAPTELRLRHADGSWRDVDVVASYRVDDPAVRGVIVNARDVTERRDAERRAEEYNRRLYEIEIRRRQALEINDNVVQGLSVAKYALDTGEQDIAAAAITRTLGSARAIITDLLGEDEETRLRPGDLVRGAAARVLEAPVGD